MSAVPSMRIKVHRFFPPMILTLAIALLGFSPQAETGRADAEALIGKSPPRAIVQEIEGALEKALLLYRRGERQKAKATVSGAYFDLFEGKGLEALLATRSSHAKVELEAIFGKIIGLIRAGAPPNQVEQQIQRLVVGLGKAARLLETGESPPWAALVNSFLIILREGFEAILILSALTAYLAKTGHDPHVKVVYRGAGLALLVSLLTAFLIQQFLAQNPASQEVMEGATMLLAAGVLFYVSYWLTSRAEAARWTAFIQDRVSRSLSRGSLFALGFTAFLAVYREGAETILFYRALLSGSQGVDTGLIGLGFLLGCAALAGLFLLFQAGSLRVPIRPFFTFTGLFLYYLAFSFAGEGIAELQVAGAISATPVSWVPSLHLLRIYPTVESLICQGILVSAALFALGYLFIFNSHRNSHF